jgi:hypothetical protein
VKNCIVISISDRLVASSLFEATTSRAHSENNAPKIKMREIPVSTSLDAKNIQDVKLPRYDQESFKHVIGLVLDKGPRSFQEILGIFCRKFPTEALHSYAAPLKVALDDMSSTFSIFTDETHKYHLFK